MSHAPSQLLTTVTPVSPTGATKKPKTKRAKAAGFTLSRLARVASTPSTQSRQSLSPLLAAAESRSALALSRAEANLARIAGGSGGAAGTSVFGPTARAAGQPAVTGGAGGADRRTGARSGVHGSSTSGSFPVQTLRTVTQLVRVVPGWVWLALAASLGLALMAAIAAVAAARRARREARALAAVSAVALTDPLTGVLNRRGFIEAAEREVDRAGRHNRPFVMAFSDVQGLKGVNDGEGHLAGDQLLKAATTVLSQSVRAHDVVGRLGGDEFGLLLTEQTDADAEHVAKRIAEQVTACRADLGFSARWDLTVGMAAFPKDGSTVDELLAAADRRLYEQRGIELAATR